MWTPLKPFLAVLLLGALLSGPAPSPALAEDAAYKIQTGDTLQMDVLEDDSLSRSLLVLPDGTITVPSGGVVPVAGKTLPQVQAAVIAALAPNFAKPPTVYISVGQVNPDAKAEAAAAKGGGAATSVYVMGEVTKPGRVSVASGTTLLQFLAETGGLTAFAATKRIQLRRMGADGTEKLWLFDYDAVMAGAPAPLIILKKGDVIIVPARRLFE